MLFNSIEYALFLPIVFTLYWFITNRSLKLQNSLIIVASYIFYGWWDWRFLSLVALSTGVDYLVALKIEKTEKDKIRKRILAISLAFNLGLLCSLKYFNFFAESFSDLISLFGLESDKVFLKVILPVGISFYTFQTMSYTIDVYRRKIPAASNIIDFAAYVSFFPQLVAGPIERATNLLPQFQKSRVFDRAFASEGCRQILWGLFKKVVVADQCAPFVNMVFGEPDVYSSYSLFLAALSFTFQIYGDFSGYSDIAIGTAKLFGFRLMTNFSFPYFSRDIAEFWRRWHISLSTWFRDYVYFPLGGSRGSKMQQVRNVMIIFLLSGLWHGANWTFIVWGAYHGLLFLPLILLGRNRTNMDIVAKDSMLPSIREMINMLLLFSCVLIGWIIFRADNIGGAIHYIVRMLSLDSNNISSMTSNYNALMFGFLMLAIEWVGRRNHSPLTFRHQTPVYIRWAGYYAVLFLVLYNLAPKQDFIYFQF